MAPVSTKIQKLTKQLKNSKKRSRKGNNSATKSKYFAKTLQGRPERIIKRPETNVGANLHERTPSMPVPSEERLSVNKVKPMRLEREFFDCPTEILAVSLLGKLLCRLGEGGERISGRIVETEGYLGEIDKACHCYKGRRTGSNEAMYGSPGTSYVYFIYGMYHCFNISSQEEGACVLVRALEPLEGLDTMRMLRSQKRKSTSKPLKDHELTNGPSKLCSAMNITKSNLNHTDLSTSDCFWVENDPNIVISEIEVVHTRRIGISSYGPEAANKPYRYYISGNKCVSVRDKIAEQKLTEKEN